jgi:hypothetical protein
MLGYAWVTLRPTFPFYTRRDRLGCCLYACLTGAQNPRNFYVP